MKHEFGKCDCCSDIGGIAKDLQAKIEELTSTLKMAERALKSAKNPCEFLIARNPQHEQPHKIWKEIDDALDQIQRVVGEGK